MDSYRPILLMYILKCCSFFIVVYVYNYVNNRFISNPVLYNSL